MDISAAIASATESGPLVLDGGLATELERAGHDLSSSLWSARLLRDDPAAIAAAHARFFAAGADVATTASYQATFEGFAAAGMAPAETVALIRQSVALAREAAEAVDRPTFVAGSVGPYGALLADGSEYTGSYVGSVVDVAALRQFHQRRMEVLVDAGADVLACETVPASAEAEAILLALDDLGAPAWLSLTTIVDGDGVAMTRRGERAADVFAMAHDVDAVVAVGVNCTEPSAVAAGIAAAAVAGKPIVVYPNSGERWDAEHRRWYGDPAISPEAAVSWVHAGARLVGGCCRVFPEQIAALAAAVRGS